MDFLYVARSDTSIIFIIYNQSISLLLLSSISYFYKVICTMNSSLLLDTHITTCLTLTLTLTVAIGSLLAAVTVIHTVGSYLGYPFGLFISRFIPAHQHQRQHNTSTSNTEEARITASALAFTLCFLALSLELYVEGSKDAAAGKPSQEILGMWDLWRVEGVLVRACVEGLATLGLLRLGISLAGLVCRMC